MTTAQSADRQRILYVSIDPHDHRAADGTLRGHGPNLDRMRHAAATWRSGAVVDELWANRLDPSTLEATDLLAIFLSGSFTDWAEMPGRPEWRSMLDRLSDQLRNWSVPTLAVCGSHQLVASAIAGWRAVGHMAPLGERVVTIAEESDGVSRAPLPRVGEIGTFHYNPLEVDPLFAGLAVPGEPLIFSQWHCDHVLAEALRTGVESIVRPAALNDAALDPAFPPLSARPPEGRSERREASDRDVARRNVDSLEECCRVQALRYDLPRGRILYTTQFHPDLEGTDRCGRPDHGTGLLHRFFDLADAFWQGQLR